MKNVLITGGSSGIGFEISRRFAQNGCNIFWVSLEKEELIAAKKSLQGALPDIQVEYLVQDLSLEDGVEFVSKWVASKGIIIDVLVNNAGYGCFGFTSSISREKEENMIQLNVFSLYRLTRFFLDEMMNRNEGTIINISSNTSLQPVPKMAVYSATKSFVSHYSQSLSMELEYQKSKVKVITICPAAIRDTKFKSKAGMDHIKTFNGLVTTDKNEVADDVWKAYDRGINYRLSGLKLRLSYPLMSILPKFIINAIIRWELSGGK
jgi:short-subunit dehydrogenase